MSSHATLTLLELIYVSAFDGATARLAGNIPKASSHERTVDRLLVRLKPEGSAVVDRGEWIEQEAQQDASGGRRRDFSAVLAEYPEDDA